MSEMQAQTVQGPASNSLISDGQPQVVNPKNLYPTMARQAQPLPPLVRRNGLALSRSETSFPAMGYDEDVYEPWPIDAVERAVELYPDLKKREPAMRQLVTLPPEPIEPPVVLVQSTPPEPVNPFEPGRSDPRIRRPW